MRRDKEQDNRPSAQEQSVRRPEEKEKIASEGEGETRPKKEARLFSLSLMRVRTGK